MVFLVVWGPSVDAEVGSGRPLKLALETTVVDLRVESESRLESPEDTCPIDLRVVEHLAAIAGCLVVVEPLDHGTDHCIGCY